MTYLDDFFRKPNYQGLESVISSSNVSTFASHYIRTPCCLSTISVPTGLNAARRLRLNNPDVLVTFLTIHGNIVANGCAAAIKQVTKHYNGNYLLRVGIKDSYYYISRGFILDSEYRPLLFTLFTYGKTEDSNYRYVKDSVIVRISPRVFYEDGIMNKFIKTKIIPYLSVADVYVENDYQKLPMLIDDSIDSFIHKVPYRGHSTSNEVMNEYLANVIDNIIIQ